MNNWTAIVMAAGAGSRMHSRHAKVVHTVGGKPMLRRAIDAARAAGIDCPVVVIAPNAEDVRLAAGDGVRVAVQEQQHGTADAAGAAQEVCAGAAQVLVLNGDLPLIFPETLRSLCCHHEETNADLTLLTAATPEKAGLARIRRDPSGKPVAIVEERDADEATLEIDEINAGVYCFRAGWLWSRLPLVKPSPVSGELYLTELVQIAAGEGAKIEAQTADAREVRGVNTRAELAVAERIARARRCEELMADGVTILDPATTYVDDGVCVGQDTVIYPNTMLTGETIIGEDCEIGPNSVIRSGRIGDGCRVLGSVIEDSTLEAGVSIGPFSHLREGAYLEAGAHLGNYAEVKKSRIGAGTQMHHFSYVGDASVGRGVNIGAGTITCNYDGKDKHQTIIGAGAFIGSDTMLIAPVTVGDGGRTGAGSVVTRDVAPGALVVGVPARPFERKPVPSEPADTALQPHPKARTDT
jgi:bifunctional UDP-N-acetylglucosamine pyrophosphorylase/glucosamine-1-phosphate N-acetyltransferase